MTENVVAICPSLERLDLVRDMVHSYQDISPDRLESTKMGEEPHFIGGPPPLIIVASGRDDGTEGWCINQGIEVIRSEEPLTYAQAVNRGVRWALTASDGPEQNPAGINLDVQWPPRTTPITMNWVLLLNNDLVLQPGFWDGFQEMVDLHYDIIGAKLLYANNTIQHFGKWFTLDFYPFHVIRWQPADHPMAQMPRPFPDVTFACVAISRQVWDALEGLDEGYNNGFEDDDFCLRARELGAQIGVHPGMLAIHKEAQTTGFDTANKDAQWQRFKGIWVNTGRISWPLGVHQGWKFV